MENHSQILHERIMKRKETKKKYPSEGQGRQDICKNK